MSIVLGIDVGASKTTCVALDVKTRQVISRGVSLGAHWTDSDTQKAKQDLWKGISDCLNSCGKSSKDVISVCVGSPGIDFAEDGVLIANAVKSQLSGDATVTVYSDAVTALASGTGGALHGCVLIAGTGTVAFGMVNGKIQARASGWGPAFMDGGSGYDLGSRALSAVAKAHDGRGAGSILVEAITQHLGVNKVEDLVRWAYTEQSWARIASLAPIVVECASQGDAVADTVLKHGVGELLRSIKAVTTKLDLERTGQPFPLVLAGGLLTEGCLYTQYMLEVLKEAIPTASVSYPAVEPAEAAAWLAYNQARVRQYSSQTQ
mmetsp:Transcript_19064/g.41089  ORF Transcript_19064/g.41089 Transcript_19064/m.41089 type:complete len:320 (-) Transcript_19064:1924-2883(-)|eukprot:CAMPEP_0202921572 /NCGR_PEP_ID=MMETSP1392-20130828/77463_1 /ASSEMBLY_ACC=CAM_ASM_000868 /TAXON_ID=225041 /ORGANISM="Chlamydomonas chlamydogama, Strain SAG 11-48b" /LENGTH=319 /DNA_ID=CAMNT_0049615151 /DNA_START=291 /DNA_END=1250 /DNA_ORIENTATION=-